MSRYAVVCTGQGAQTPDLFDRIAWSPGALALRDEVLGGGALEADVAAWLRDPKADPDKLFLDHFAQPLLALYQSMLWHELAARLPRPALVAGYSLGEVSAYAVAGALTAADTVSLAGVRARKMDHAAASGALIVVLGLAPQRVRDIAAAHGGYLSIRITDDHVIAGCLATDAAALADALRASGAATVELLKVTVASHTPLLDAAVGPFRDALAACTLSAPRVPVLAGVDAAKITRPEQAVALLPEQIHRTIRWDLVMNRIAESGTRVVLELGPGKQLAHMFLDTHPGVESRSVDEFRTLDGVAAWLARRLV